jgi:hypothetical protein
MGEGLIIGEIVGAEVEGFAVGGGHDRTSITHEAS